MVMKDRGLLTKEQLDDKAFTAPDFDPQVCAAAVGMGVPSVSACFIASSCVPEQPVHEYQTGNALCIF